MMPKKRFEPKPRAPWCQAVGPPRPPSLSRRRREGAAETEWREPGGRAHARPAGEEPRDGFERAPRGAGGTGDGYRRGGGPGGGGEGGARGGPKTPRGPPRPGTRP